MTKDKKIDLILTDFFNDRTVCVPDYIYYKFGDGNDMSNRRDCDELIEFMISQDLITSNNGYNYTIRPKGIHIYETGGWQKHKERQISEDLKNSEFKEKEREKLFWESKLLKWQVKTFWPLFILAIIGAVMGGISLIWQIVEKSGH